MIYPAGMFVGSFRPTPTLSYAFFGLLGFVVGGSVALFVIDSNILEEGIGDSHLPVTSRSGEPFRARKARVGSSDGLTRPFSARAPYATLR